MFTNWQITRYNSFCTACDEVKGSVLAGVVNVIEEDATNATPFTTMGNVEVVIAPFLESAINLYLVVAA